MRLDLLLVEWGFAPSRTKAQELIKHGDVEIHVDGEWHVVRTASSQSHKTEKDQIRIKSMELLQYVSRGGLKLKAALEVTNWDVKGVHALDVGISTGGFTDCLLQFGAASVVGLDVGTGQLAKKLRSEPKLIYFENKNARAMSTDPEIVGATGDVNFCVADVSFISLEMVLPQIKALLGPHRLLVLVKPQFELQADCLTKQGLVKNDALCETAINRVRGVATALGYTVEHVFPCAWKGGDGNQEYFLAAHL